VLRLALALTAFLAAAPAAAGSADEPMVLRLLSYNVHGFWMAGAKLSSEERSLAIGELLGRYDLVLLQEDFQYHDLLTRAFRYSIDERGNAPRSHWGLASVSLLTAPLRLLSSRATIPQGSGLSILSRHLEAAPRGVTREYLGACYGWLGHANDCLASKGFLRVRVRLPSGDEIDVYDTHLDAGSSDGDREARRVQLSGLAERIESLSAGRAVILAGDFNSRCDGAAEPPWPDCAAFAELRTRLGLEDSGARPDASRGWGQRIDYVLFRGAEGVDVRLLASGEDLRFERAGGPLSDHPAILAELEVRSRAPR
jgi:endonuclease/exonuclease/phosphatase (EEP) superfamily protein YafD